MGTNYYLHAPACEHCGRGDEPLHIGKSSAGWTFSLHVTDEIRSLEAWRERWPSGVIRDEYGKAVAPEAMLSIITDRSGGAWKDRDYPVFGYASPSDFLAKNHAMEGPNGLLTAQPDGERYSRPDDNGTYDLVRGEFS